VVIELFSQHLAPIAGHGIDQIRYVPCGDPKSEWISGDRLPTDESGGRERRGYRREFVDDDLARRAAAQYGHERKGGVLPAYLAGGGPPTLRDQIQDGTLTVRVEYETAIGAGLGLSQLLRCARACCP